MSQPEFTEEELRQLEAEMQRITVDDVLLQTTVTLLNLAARKAGLGAPPGEAPAPDWEQVRQAIEGARAILPAARAAPQRAARPGPRHAVAAADGLRAAVRRRGRGAGARAGRRAAGGARRPAAARGAWPGAELRPAVDPRPVTARAVHAPR